MSARDRAHLSRASSRASSHALLSSSSSSSSWSIGSVSPTRHRARVLVLRLVRLRARSRETLVMSVDTCATRARVPAAPRADDRAAPRADDRAAPRATTVPLPTPTTVPLPTPTTVPLPAPTLVPLPCCSLRSVPCDPSLVIGVCRVPFRDPLTPPWHSSMRLVAAGVQRTPLRCVVALLQVAQEKPCVCDSHTSHFLCVDKSFSKATCTQAIFLCRQVIFKK